MLDDSKKIIITCRFIQHDQWLTTHIEPSWTIRQLKLWLIHRLFSISIPQRIFSPTPLSGKSPECPPSPITFAPDPSARPASPIISAPPQKSEFYDSGGGGGTAGRGWSLSDTEEDLLSGSDGSGFSSSGEKKIKFARMMKIGIDPSIPSGRTGPTITHRDTECFPRSPTATTTNPAVVTSDADKYPGGINPSHWSITRYSTGQLLADDESIISWYDIHEFELVELHGPSFQTTHVLYEYQVCHLWNPERHRERERLRGKLKKRFEAEAILAATSTGGTGTGGVGGGGGGAGGGGKHSKDKDKTIKDKDKDRAAYHAQILKAMNLNSGAGANVGVVEYYGQKISKTKVELALSRIPRSIDVYVQPYWEGWVRTLRIVWRGDWSDIAFAGVAGVGGSVGGGSGGSGGGSGGGGSGQQTMQVQQIVADPYRYGVHSGTTVPGEKDHHHHGKSSVQQQKLVRVEWRERWVKIQNGYLAVLKDREDDEATHVLPLKNIISLTNTQHLVRYLSYSGFNPPLDHPAVTPEILIPAVNLHIQRPPRPPHGYFDNSSSSDKESDSDRYHYHHRKGGHGSTGHSHGHHGSGSWVGGGGGGGKEFNFSFLNASSLHQHTKARELTPLVGSRFDPTYLPITIDEQKASGLRVVCLQFRKHPSSSYQSSRPSTSTTTTTATTTTAINAGIPSSMAANRKKTKQEEDEEREKEKEREREYELDPTTLALEDMKERAGELGGVRSNNPLWKCPSKLRTEPVYLTRFKFKMKMRNSRSGGGGSRVGISGTSGKASSSGTSSTLRGLKDPYGSISTTSTSGGGRTTHHHHHHHHHRHHHVRKDRIYRNRDRAYYENDIELQGMLAARVFGSSKRKKERPKQEKELLRERKRKEKENDWGLGLLNVGFWNWGKKKRAKKERMERQLNLRMQEHERDVEEHFITGAGPSSTVSGSGGGGGCVSVNTITPTGAGRGAPGGSSATVVGGARSVRPSSNEDETEFAAWDRGQSGKSNVETTEDDEDDEPSDGDGDEDEDGVLEPYLDDLPDNPLVAVEVDEEETEILRNTEGWIRYGLFNTGREEEKRRYERELEEQREREAKIREQKGLDEKEMQKEEKKKRPRRERERRKKKKDEDGEWVCLDIGNDFAFQSFLRIIHQHCPHPMKSSFMERMLGGPLDDQPPPPQTLTQPPSVGPSSPSARFHHVQHAPLGLESILESKDIPAHFSMPNSPTSLRSQQTTSSPSSAKSHQPQHPSTPTSPSVPSNHTISSPSSHLTPPSPSSSDEEIDSDTEYVTPLPGYGDPRFQYPARTSTTLPYPEWRLNILRKAQRAGMGDVGRPMETIYWGREDPVIAGASGVTNDFESLGIRWGTKGGVAGFQYVREKKGKGKKKESGGGEDNVSSLGTIGQKTVGSGGTVKGVSVGSPTNQRKVSGKSVRSTGSSKGVIPDVPREGGDSGNESSREDSDGGRDDVSSASSAADDFSIAKSPRISTRMSSMHMRLSNWSDEEEENASELEWPGWQMDVHRQARRQYAIQARRDANSAMGMDTESPMETIYRGRESRHCGCKWCDE